MTPPATPAIERETSERTPHPGDALVDRMLDEFNRPGRSGGAGFYEYADGRRTRLWPGLRRHFVRPGVSIPFEDLKERMLFIEAVEAVKCLDEGVLTSVADANIGSILGIGYRAGPAGCCSTSISTEAVRPVSSFGPANWPPVTATGSAPPRLLLATAEEGLWFE